MKRRLLIATLALCATACEGPIAHRNPEFVGQVAPSPTLLTGAVACLDKAVVVAGGQLVRRATGFGEEVVLKVNMRVATAGDTAPAFPSSLCTELASEQALDPGDWLNPKPPAILAELAAMSEAQTVFVPVVTSTMECSQKLSRWRWGTPAYEDERGDLDCAETRITVIGYLFDAKGAVLWKGILARNVDSVPDGAALANEMMLEAPIGTPVSLTR